MADQGSIGTLYHYELKMLLRDRRTLFFSVVLPLLLIPVMIFLIRFTSQQAEERRESRTYTYALAGSETELARELILEALELSIPTPGRGTAFIEAQPADPDSALMAGEIDVVVEALTPGEAMARRDAAADGAPDQAGSPDDGAASPNVPVIRLHFRGNRDPSETGARLLGGHLRELRQARREGVYREAGLPLAPGEVAAVELHGVASAERESGAQLAVWLTPLLVMLMLTGGSVVAADAISGEKERGTLETLLTTSVRRREIVAAKQLLIVSVGVAITLINVTEIALFLGLGWFELPERFVVSVAPTAVVLLLLLFLPLSVLISSVLLMLSGYSRSYKEYQIYFLPVMLVFLLPSLTAALPGMELASAIAFVPLANISVAVREILVGEYDWAYLAITVLTTTALAAWLARLTERTLSTEKLITAAEMDEADLRGGPALFPRRVLRWFALLWVVLFLSSLWLEGELGLRGQVLYNVVGIFLGGSLLMIWRYRLDPRRALALRMPRPAVWAGVLIGAPSAFIVGVGLAQLGQGVFPVSEETLRAFGEFLFPEGMPLWQVVFFLAVVPAICEEIAFRGLLLHGLRRRFRPVTLALVVGLIFGLFHVSLFRLIPTTYLGVLLAGVTLATGSIFPAMLWHGLNNAMPLVPTYLGWWDTDTVFPLWLYPVALLALAAAAALIWKNRTPYPGLRTGTAYGAVTRGGPIVSGTGGGDG